MKYDWKDCCFNQLLILIHICKLSFLFDTLIVKELINEECIYFTSKTKEVQAKETGSSTNKAVFNAEKRFHPYNLRELRDFWIQNTLCRY